MVKKAINKTLILCCPPYFTYYRNSFVPMLPDLVNASKRSASLGTQWLQNTFMEFICSKDHSILHQREKVVKLGKISGYMVSENCCVSYLSHLFSTKLLKIDIAQVYATRPISIREISFNTVKMCFKVPSYEPCMSRSLHNLKGKYWGSSIEKWSNHCVERFDSNLKSYNIM